MNNCPMNSCPLCDNTKCLLPIEYKEIIKHNGQNIVVEGLQGCYCISCGADPVLEHQIRYNHKRIKEEKAKYDNS